MTSHSKNKSKKFTCWGTPVYSSWEISDVLRRLNVSHSLRKSRTEAPAEIELGFNQPKRVHVANKTTDLRENCVNFICASYADLSHTNIPRFPDANQYELELAMKMMLESQHPEIELNVNTPSALDYVNLVSKSSQLNQLQTLIYKIQPYSLRKETQDIILRYYTGRVSKTTIKFFLRKSFKTSDLVTVINESDALREAVIRTKTVPVEQVAKETGIASFDLIYLGKERIQKPARKKIVKDKKTMPNSMRLALEASGKVVKF